MKSSHKKYSPVYVSCGCYVMMSSNYRAVASVFIISPHAIMKSASLVHSALFMKDFCEIINKKAPVMMKWAAGLLNNVKYPFTRKCTVNLSQSI